MDEAPGKRRDSQIFVCCLAITRFILVIPQKECLETWKYIVRFLVSKTWSNFNKFGTKPKLHHDDLKPYSIVDLCRPIFSNFSLFFRWWDIYHIYNTETTDSSDHKAWRSLKINSRFLFSKAINYKTILLHPIPQKKQQILNPPTNIPCALQIQNQTPNHKPQPQPQLHHPTPWCCSLQRYKVQDVQCIQLFSFKTAFGGGRSSGFGLSVKFQPEISVSLFNLFIRLKLTQSKSGEVRSCCCCFPNSLV